MKNLLGIIISICCVTSCKEWQTIIHYPEDGQQIEKNYTEIRGMIELSRSSLDADFSFFQKMTKKQFADMRISRGIVICENAVNGKKYSEVATLTDHGQYGRFEIKK